MPDPEIRLPLQTPLLLLTVKPVKEFHIVNPSLRIWQKYDPASKVDCTATALRTDAGWLLVDPIPLRHAALDELLAGEKLAGIILTSGNHERAAWEIRDALQSRIYAPSEARQDVEADIWFKTGETILGVVRTFPIAGAGPGEVALLSDGVLVLGDAVIHLDALEPLPDKYSDDPELLRESLGLLLKQDFDIVCFAHGLPLLHEGKRRLREMLAAFPR